MNRNKVNKLLKENEEFNDLNKEIDVTNDTDIVDIEETESEETDDDDLEIDEIELGPIEVVSGIDEEGNVENPVEAILKPGDTVAVVDENGIETVEVETDEEGNLSTETIEDELSEEDMEILDIIDMDDDEEEIETEESIESEIENIETGEEELVEESEEVLSEEDIEVLDIIDMDDEKIEQEYIDMDNISKDDDILEEEVEDEEGVLDETSLEELDIIEEDININYDNDESESDLDEESNEEDLNDLSTNETESEEIEELSTEELADADLGDLSLSPEEQETTSEIETSEEDEFSPEEESEVSIDDVDEGQTIDKQEDEDELVVELLSDSEDYDYITDLETEQIDLKEAVVSDKVKNKTIQVLQETVKKLQLENYKLLKVNGILNLLPNLNVETKERLAESFDKCKTATQVQTLYKKVTEVSKESRKPKLNNLILENNKGFSTLGKTILNEEVETEYALTKDQKRLNYLMGVNENEEEYYNN